MIYHGVMNTERRQSDIVDRLRDGWQRARPEWDTSSIEVLGRITRTAVLANAHLDRVLEPAGITRSEFELMCVLARADRPLRASDVTAETMLSGAATTKLTARLEQAGLLTRERLERDGRVVLLALTAAGQEIVDAEFPRCMNREGELLADLDDSERTQLAALLARVMATVERG